MRSIMNTNNVILTFTIQNVSIKFPVIFTFPTKFVIYNTKCFY